MNTTTTKEATMSEQTRTTSREEIAANVRAAMARAQLEQQTVATAIGKSATAVSDRLRAVTHFRVDELQIIAGMCGVPLEELLAPATTPAPA